MMNETTLGVPLHEHFRVLGEAVRFRLFRILAEAAEPLCICELVDVVRRPEYAVSRSMGALRRAGLVSVERRGKLVYYRIADTRAAAGLAAVVLDWAAQASEGNPRNANVIADLELSADSERLAWRLALRENGECRITYTEGPNPRSYRYYSKGSSTSRARDRESAAGRGRGFADAQTHADAQTYEEGAKHE
jgi:ArsR family transcriptional regulator